MSADCANQIIGLYERHVHAWDAGRSRTLFEKPWLDRFAALLPPNASILDIGCGAGEPIAAYLAGRGFHMTGIDSSAAMIALAEARMPRQTWLVGDMRHLALGRRFDGIIAWDSFFHLTREDQRAVFPIFRAHAGAGCALLFTSGPYDGEAIGTFEGEPLYHASLAPEIYRSLLAEAAFSVIGHVSEDPECGRHTVWLARRV